MYMEKTLDLRIHCRDYLQQKPSQPRTTITKFLVATVKKIVDNLSVNIDCKRNNCTKNELYNPVDVNSINNLDYNNPMGGNRELTL